MTPRSDLPRKLLHTVMGLVALLFRWLSLPWAAALAAAAVLTNRFVMPVLAGELILRPGERERGVGGGVVLYPVMVLALVLVFHDRLELAAAAWGLLAFGDGPAAMVGVGGRGGALPWNPRKSWGGFLTFVAVGWPACALLLFFVRGGAPDNPSVGESFLALGTPGLVGGCGLAALAAAWAESVDVPVDDNIRVAVVGGTVLGLASLVTPEGLGLAAERAPALLWAGPAAAALAGFAVLVGGTGPAGAAVGWVVATVVGWSTGPGGLAVLALVVGITVGTTRLGRARKEFLGVAESGAGRRGATRVAANLSVAGVCALVGLLGSHAGPLALAMLAALATAVFDTAGTEVGQAWGGRAYSVPFLRRVPPGTEGAVSMAGTSAGLLAAALVAVGGVASGVVGAGVLAGPAGPAALAPGPVVLSVVAGATVGSFVESWIGSLAPEGASRHNDLLNFLNTGVGAGTAVLIHGLLVGGGA